PAAPVAGRRDQARPGPVATMSAKATKTPAGPPSRDLRSLMAFGGSGNLDAVARVLGVDLNDIPDDGDGATDKQMDLLNANGVSVIGLSRPMCSALIGKIIERANDRLSTPKQIAALSRLGWPDAELRAMNV